VSRGVVYEDSPPDDVRNRDDVRLVDAFGGGGAGVDASSCLNQFHVR